ncbi:MAG: RNA recognition motif domain-containing protein [Planctomycetota bacterium]|jgi:RNA recognition motif-containing protein
MNIYVGNLAREVTEDDLREAFEAFGQVDTATVVKDRFSGESRGFGFVEMPSKDEAQAAITEMNEKDLKGRTINVNEARPKTNRGGGGGGRRGGGGGGYGGRGGRGGGGGGGGRRY